MGLTQARPNQVVNSTPVLTLLSLWYWLLVAFSDKPSVSVTLDFYALFLHDQSVIMLGWDMYWPEFITVSVCNSHTWTHKELDPAVLHALPKLPLDWALLHLKQEAGCIYVNNVGPWNAIMYLGNHSLVLSYQHCSVLHYVVQFCSEKFLMSCLRKKSCWTTVVQLFWGSWHVLQYSVGFNREKTIDFTVGKVCGLPLRVWSWSLNAQWVWYICQFQRFGKNYLTISTVKSWNTW